MSLIIGEVVRRFETWGIAKMNKSSFVYVRSQLPLRLGAVVVLAASLGRAIIGAIRLPVALVLTALD